MSLIPGELKYSESHEWVRANDDGSMTVGITDHAQELLGDLVYVELPELDRELEEREACAVVESVKAASDLYAPIACSVVEVNEALADAPEVINTDAYGAGWIMRVQPESQDVLNALMDAEAYEAFIEAE